MFNFNKKEFKLVPRTRKVVDLTKKLNAKNLNDLIFTAIGEGNIEILAELIKAFAEDANNEAMFKTIDETYEFIDEWMAENKKSCTDLYEEVAEVVNEMGFFKKKMKKEELKETIQNPMPMINLQDLVANSAQKMMDKMAEEEFQGYKG